MIEEAVQRPPTKTYLNAEVGIWSWLLTTDHKRIGILYTISITFFFFLGGFFALLMRLELVQPRNWLVSAETYNKLFSMHGIIMVWFFLIPSIPNTLGNFVLPMAVGAKDLAFPKLNLASWYVFMLGAAVTIYAIFRGGVDTGWTFYTPFSTDSSTTYVTVAATGIFINGFSSIMTGINFIATVHRMRAPGLTWFKLPIFVWSHYATSMIFVLATPVLAVTLLMVASNESSRSASSTPRLAAIPCCSSISSGSTPIRRFTSWSCPPWPLSVRSFLPSPASHYLATRRCASRA
jgi:cytochrome c oxidase subunit 1